MRYLRWLLLPFSIIYGLVMLIRNWLYDTRIFKIREFDLPVISVGNLDVGGAGKSPMTEYLIRILKADNAIAILSRGYGRDTRGFILADTSATAKQIGDEPAQFKHKFPELTVAVCEDRVRGIELLEEDHEVILLDDAFQHRAVKPGLSILLFDYSRIDHIHVLLPAGNLREPFSGRWRADIMVVTKCPPTITDEEKTRAYYRIDPLNWQPVFFTAIKYMPLQDLHGNMVNKVINNEDTVFLLTGIANSNPLVQHIKEHTPAVIHHKYPDHHQFSLKNITKLAREFNACKAQNKFIVTTEKDAQRLLIHRKALKGLPVFVLPIGVEVLGGAQPEFDQLILNYVRKN
ncbi:tetraacyldisaccharide 4'-kinase [Mucilaginibacter segetis]|uniref:Tetraacyldisaccharide 4'-kinase n=1 Tax=Mucilaginibacter segetis TaxID=2793071 RepID=A0A934PW73_9SPHI|nr:tetraacyldisaccharide 4'-kinase [Mucilaginibacter segetis]MBK0380535.1 tetraacyldisaccharide 4'-kinase [Mucilaginibacter segetis]